MTDAIERLLDSLDYLLASKPAARAGTPAADTPVPDPPHSPPEGRAPHSPALGGGRKAISGDEPALNAGRVLPEVLDALRDPQVRERAIRALIRLGDPAVLALFDVLHDDDREVRRAAARALARIRDRRGLEALARTAEWTYPYAREPLKRQGLAKLRDALANGSRASRVVVAVAFGRLGERRALPDLIEALNDPSPLARLAAVWALGRIGDPVAAPHLLDALDDADPLIALAAREALGQIANGR